MKLKDLLKEANVKYYEFNVRNTKGKNLGVFYTDMNKATREEVDRYVKGLRTDEERSKGISILIPMSRGTDAPNGKYIKPSVIKKGAAAEIKRTKKK